MLVVAAAAALPGTMPCACMSYVDMMPMWQVLRGLSYVDRVWLGRPTRSPSH